METLSKVKVFFSPLYADDLQSGVLKNEPELTYMSAWCHGAPGIGMARSHAYHLTKDEKYFEDVKKSTANTIQANKHKISNYTLCHGLFGNLSLLIDNYIATGNQLVVDIAVEETKTALTEALNTGYYISGISKTAGKADADFFNGTSGIGHFLLRMCYPKKIRSILLPIVGDNQISLSLSRYKNLFDINFLNELLYSKTFVNTSLVVKMPHFIDNANVLQENCLLAITEGMQARSQNWHVSNNYWLDMERKSIENKMHNSNYYYIKHLVDYENAKVILKDIIDLDKLLKMDFCFNETIFLYPLSNATYTIYNVLVPSHRGNFINQYYISRFSYSVLLSFSNNETTIQVYQKMSILYKHMPNFNAHFYKQMLDFIRLTWLVKNAIPIS
jgi:hypothetical protein